MSEKKELVDLVDKNKGFAEINKSLQKLDLGFTAIGLDYGYHTEGIFTGNNTIFELRDNVKYRIFSSNFHLEMLLRHLYHVEHLIDEKFKKNPDLVFHTYMPVNPHFYSHEREVSALFDSIVFHLSSIYDYMSLLVNYICGGRKEERIIWTQLAKSVRDKNNRLSKRKVANVVDNIDRQFVAALYDHRSELIHRESDLSNFRHTIQLDSGDSNVHFICTGKLVKRFKKIIDNEKEYSVSYFSYLIIDNTFTNVAKLLYSLKEELEQNSKFPTNLRNNSSNLFLAYVDPVSNRMMSPSVTYWPSFQEHFKLG